MACACILLLGCFQQVNDAANTANIANGTSNGGATSHGPVRVAVVFAGRQSSGGHNILWGLHEFLKGTDSTVRESRKSEENKQQQSNMKKKTDSPPSPPQKKKYIYLYVFSSHSFWTSSS